MRLATLVCSLFFVLPAARADLAPRRPTEQPDFPAGRQLTPDEVRRLEAAEAETGRPLTPEEETALLAQATEPTEDGPPTEDGQSTPDAEDEAPTDPEAQPEDAEGSVAAAPTEDEEPTAIEEALAGFDATFGEWVVGPIATIYFFDLAFWDSPPAPGDDFEVREVSLGDNEKKLVLKWVNEGDLDSLSAKIGVDAASAILAARPEDGFATFEDLDSVEGYDERAHYLFAAHANTLNLPMVVVWLVLGALFFTFRYGFPNIRALGHAIAITRGKYDDDDDPGEVSHFQALSSALSATVGLGNIAGVAVAVGAGGPGAVFWMVVAAFFGMCSKFSECTLGQMYRQVDVKGNVSGGPMRYLDSGLKEMGFGRFGKVLAVMFSIMCIGGSFGGGNMFQANQSYAQVSQVLPFLDSGVGAVGYGVLLAALVGVVIIGGIKRIGKVAGYIVPIMCGVYVIAGFIVLFANASEIPSAFGKIVGEAFSPSAIGGGMLGVLIQGFRRAAFSNEAGVGSASIAHSAAATDEPVREGIVALLEPFIDTIIVCTMTGLVVVITGAYAENLEGVEMTSRAFNTVIPGFRYVLSFAVFMFAFSTMISWSYYGERCWTYLFGTGTSMVYKVVFLLFVVVGSVLKLGSVIDFSDLMILGMAFPNILGMYFLSGKVKRAFDDYWKRLKSGAMDPEPTSGGEAA